MAAFNQLLIISHVFFYHFVFCIEQLPIQSSDSHGSSLIHDILVRNEIIGDVLDDFEPTMSLSVSYPDSHEDVILGNEIPVSNVSDAPVFEFHPFVGPHNGPSFHRRQRLKSPRAGRSSPLFQAPVLNPSEDLIYTLALTDPDAKSRYNPIWSEMAHWIVTNLTLIPNIASPSDHFSFNDISPSTLLPYLPPSPPPKTGPHRYVFVLLAGTPEATAKLIPPKKSKEGRQHWGYDEERTGVKKWAEDNGGLEIVGVNFFFARSEEQ